jgi:CRISPR-associated endoribonuclease Cas6
MPKKLRFYLEGDAPKNPFQHSAGLRAAIFRWLAESDACLAQFLHDANQVKPLAISPLWSASESLGGACFEVAILTDPLEDFLTGSLGEGEAEIILGRATYKLIRWETVASASWGSLLRIPQVPCTEFNFRLLTPTAHHRQGRLRKSIVLPSPELYFGSWFNRWNLCSPTPMPDELLRVVDDRMVVSACAGSTQSVPQDRGRVFIGFVGAVRFALLSPDCVPLEFQQMLLALARFASFCGTGVDTMRGMGQTLFLERAR